MVVVMAVVIGRYAAERPAKAVKSLEHCRDAYQKGVRPSAFIFISRCPFVTWAFYVWARGGFSVVWTTCVVLWLHSEGKRLTSEHVPVRPQNPYKWSLHVESHSGASGDLRIQIPLIIHTVTCSWIDQKSQNAIIFTAWHATSTVFCHINCVPP